MDKSIVKISCWNLLSIVAFFCIFYFFNALSAEVEIPIVQIATISMLFGGYYSILFAASWQILSNGISSTIMGISILAVTICFLVFYGYSLFYKWLPSLGINFHYPGKDFSLLAFRERLMRGYLATWIFSVGMVFFVRFMRNRKLLKEAVITRDQLVIEIRSLQTRVHTKHISPHFVENLIAITMGEMTVSNKKQSLDSLLILAEIMHYAIEMQEINKSVSLAREWEYVSKLIYLSKVWKGEKAVVWNQTTFFPQIVLPIGLLLMPLENAIKYGSISKQEPLQVSFEMLGNDWEYTVSNSYIRLQRASVRSGKTGIVMMRQRLTLDNWPITMEIFDEDDRFKIRFKGKL